MAPSSVADWVDAVTTSDTWAQVVARAWADETFHTRLLADPTTILYEAGVDVPTGIEVLVQEASEMGEPYSACLVLPPKPAVGELMEERLTAQVDAGPARLCSKMSQACGWPLP